MTTYRTIRSFPRTCPFEAYAHRRKNTSIIQAIPNRVPTNPNLVKSVVIAHLPASTFLDVNVRIYSGIAAGRRLRRDHQIRGDGAAGSMPFCWKANGRAIDRGALITGRQQLPTRLCHSVCAGAGHICAHSFRQPRSCQKTLTIYTCAQASYGHPGFPLSQPSCPPGMHASTRDVSYCSENEGRADSSREGRSTPDSTSDKSADMRKHHRVKLHGRWRDSIIRQERREQAQPKAAISET